MVHKSSASSATGAKKAEKALLSLKALVFSAYSLWALLTDDGFRENVSAHGRTRASHLACLGATQKRIKRAEARTHFGCVTWRCKARFGGIGVVGINTRQERRKGTQAAARARVPR